MKNKLLITGIFALMLLSGKAMAQQDSTIFNVLRNTNHWLDKQVTVRGIVDTYIPIELNYEEGETTHTVEYVLRGDFGNKILVRSTLSTPATHTVYEVTGLFQESNRPYGDYEIIEITRDFIATVEDGTEGTVAAAIADPQEASFWDRYGLPILIAGAVVVLLLIIFLSVLIFKKRPRYEEYYREPVQNQRPAFEEEQRGADQDFKTIKVEPNPPKTMRFIPGSLEIVGGEDKGKVFKMVGYPTGEGSVITMGRENGSGERAYSHVQLKDPTVSRKQAEIIYKGGKLFLKNLSETNHTQVNGKELAPHEQVELNANDSVIRTGAIEFKYVL